MASHTRSTTTTDTDPTLPLPRILCLHGGGVTAGICHAQFRSFLRHPELSTRFRFVFVDAPFYCDEAVGVVPVYENWGPFRRWFRWLPTHDEIDPAVCVAEIEYTISRAMDTDQGYGEWVGVLGFSQGAKLAASMLYDQQLNQEEKQKWKFGVILAGRAPLVSLSDKSEAWTWMQSAGGLPDVVHGQVAVKLQIPTVHVHGLQDVGLELHRRLVSDYCAPGTATVVEWDGQHRIPLKKVDVDPVVQKILEMARQCGV